MHEGRTVVIGGHRTGRIRCTPAEGETLAREISRAAELKEYPATGEVWFGTRPVVRQPGVVFTSPTGFYLE